MSTKGRKRNPGDIVGRSAGQSALEKALTAGAGASSWMKGAQGEVRVGSLLDSLDSKYWTVLHDLPLDTNWNLDHLVIGPTGVFAIDTKNLRGNVVVSGSHIEHNGFQVDYAEKMSDVVRRVRQNLCSAAEWDSLWVQGILAFVDTKMEVEEFPNNLLIVRAKNLVSVLCNWNGHFTWKQVKALSKAACDSRTWS